MLFYQILVCTTREKMLKSHAKTINLKYQLQHGIKNLIYLTDCILHLHFLDIEDYLEYI